MREGNLIKCDDCFKVLDIDDSIPMKDKCYSALCLECGRKQFINRIKKRGDMK
jgi:hypothetical protein